MGNREENERDPDDDIRLLISHQVELHLILLRRSENVDRFVPAETLLRLGQIDDFGFFGCF